MNKIDELNHVSIELKPDIVCISESWTNNDILDAFLKINGYNILCRQDRKDTTKGVGGGLLIYVKENITASEIHDESFDKYNQC